MTETMHQPHPAIIYAYGEDGPDRGGRPQQIARCLAFAAQHELQVLQVVSEGKWAGPTLTRPGFGSLFTALTIQPSTPSTLLMTDMTRLGRSRDLDEGGSLEYRLQRAGIQIIDVDRTASMGYAGDDTVLRSSTQHRALGEYVRELIARCSQVNISMRAISRCGIY